MGATRHAHDVDIDLDVDPADYEPRVVHDDEPEFGTSWTDPRFLVPLALFLSAVFVIGMALRAGTISPGSNTAQELVDAVVAAESRAGFSDITVRAEDDLIILEGEAADLIEATAIGAVARSVEGVSAVDNRMLVLGGTLQSAEVREPSETSEITPASTEPLADRLAAAGQITFESGTTQLTPEGTAAVNAVAELLLGVSGVQVEVHGHTDSSGDSGANQVLSQERAEAVVEALAVRGVDVSLLTAVGFGESQPIAPNITAEGRAQNRRITFLVK